MERVFHPCACVPVSLEFVRVTGPPAGVRRRCHRKGRGGKSRKEATVRVERYLSAWYDGRGLRVMELDGVVLHTRTKAQCASPARPLASSPVVNLLTNYFTYPV